MSAPVESKTIKVSPDVHRRIHSIAAKLETTADGAIAFLLGSGTVRVPVSTTERDRWNDAAQAAGLSVEEFVKLRVEAALALGCDPGILHANIERIGRTVDRLARAAVVVPPPPAPQSTTGTPQGGTQ